MPAHPRKRRRHLRPASPYMQEGWAPSTFISSRASRAERTERTATDFMDADELAELGADKLAAKADYDTFASAAADAQMKEAALLDSRKPGAALSATALAVAVVPVADGVGTRLLRKMGWRHGKGVSRLRPDGSEATGGRVKRRHRAEEGPVVASIDPELIELVVRSPPFPFYALHPPIIPLCTSTHQMPLTAACRDSPAKFRPSASLITSLKLVV